MGRNACKHKLVLPLRPPGALLRNRSGPPPRRLAQSERAHLCACVTLQVSDGGREAEVQVVVAPKAARGTGAAVAAAALPALGRLASPFASQPGLSLPELSPASACPMSVSLVVIRLELAEHSPVPAGFGFSAAGESQYRTAFPVVGTGPRRSLSRSLGLEDFCLWLKREVVGPLSFHPSLGGLPRCHL